MTQNTDGARRLFERLSAQAGRVEVKQTAYLRERDRLDRLVAEAVSTRPDSVQWYAYPGELSIDDVTKAIGGGPAGLHKIMDRQRKAAAETKVAKAKTRKTSARTQARRAATSRVHTP